MSFKEWDAVITLVGQAIIVGWLVLEAMSGVPGDVVGVAQRLCWAILAMVVLNVVLRVLALVVASIIEGREVEDEAADERDVLIDTRAGRNSGYVTSSLAALALLPLAFGFDPLLAVYMLFAAPMAGGATEAVSRLVYYRIG